MNKRSHSQLQRRSRERICRRLSYLNSTISHYIDPKSQSTCISIRLPLSAAIILDLYSEYVSHLGPLRAKKLPEMFEKCAHRLKRNKAFQSWLVEEFPHEQLRQLGVLV